MSLDVEKSYESLDRKLCMEILWLYGIRKNLQRIIEHFLEEQTLVTRYGRCYLHQFSMEWGVT